MKDSLNKFRRTLISYYKQQRIGPMIDDITKMVKRSNRMDDDYTIWKMPNFMQHLVEMQSQISLIPRPHSRSFFSTAAKEAARVRPGYEASPNFTVWMSI